jgi:hypothetical protein
MAAGFKPGDLVRLREVPPWVNELPQESQAVYRFCVGRAYLIAEVDPDGLLVLDVSRDVDQRFGGFLHDIRVEAEWVDRALSLGGVK